MRRAAARPRPSAHPPLAARPLTQGSEKADPVFLGLSTSILAGAVSGCAASTSISELGPLAGPRAGCRVSCLS